MFVSWDFGSGEWTAQLLSLTFVSLVGRTPVFYCEDSRGAQTVVWGVPQTHQADAYSWACR